MFNNNILILSILIFGVTNCQNITTTPQRNANDLESTDILPTVEGSAENQTTEQDEQCRLTYHNFLNDWRQGRYRLTVVMDYLRKWNCTQFDLECRNKTFNFNNFTALVYSRFCDYETFESNCTEQNTTELLPTNTITSACQQVQMYNSSSDYVEFILDHVPFCNVVWCGFDLNTVHKFDLSSWSCMFSKCRTNVIVILAVTGVMAVVTISVNLLVILVIASYPNSKSRQLIFKQSLAIGDLFCGLVVLPAFISTLYLRYVDQRILPSGDNIMLNNLTSTLTNQSVFTNSIPLSTTDANSSAANGVPLMDAAYPYWYLPLVGCITSLTMMVSLYTLLFSSLDQFTALRRPHAVSEAYAMRLTKTLAVLTWVVASIFALLPVFIDTLSPYEVITGLVVARGRYSIIFYCLTFLLPLLLTWTINVWSWKLLNQNEEYNNMGNESDSVQKKLISTLTEMTALFTICVFPVGISIVIHISEHGIGVSSSERITSQIYDFELVAALVLLSKGIWYCFLYNIRSEAFRSMTTEKLKSIIYSCYCYECGRNAQSNVRRLRIRMNRLI